MAKPTSLPRWSETVAGVPGTNEVEPTEGKKDTGFGTGGDIPTSGGLNWWMRLVYLWAKFLDTATSVAAASAIVVRDASGRAAFTDPSAAGDADTKGARDTAITTHNGVTNPHSATALATASRLVLRDAAGRSQIADPSAAADIATKGYVDAASPAAVKASDQAATASIVAVADLSVPVAANASYSIEFVLRPYVPGMGGNILLGLTGPTSPTIVGWQVTYRGSSFVIDGGDSFQTSTLLSLAPPTDGYRSLMIISALLKNGANAGNVQVVMQKLAVDWSIGAGSFVVSRRLA